MSRILQQQAEQLYARGVAAARGGQKAVAAGLLRQAVKLNPQHEQAWLWLSGVLDQPEDVAFCLRAVLGINPGNERAQKGLAWIEQQQPTGEQRPRRSGYASAPGTRNTDSWWSAWREAQTTRLWVFRTVLLIPIILLGSTLIIRATIAAQPLPAFVSYNDIPIPTAAPTERPAPTETPLAPTAAPTTTNQAAVVAYFERINEERKVLQTATEVYRTRTDAGRTAVERATATKQLRNQVQRSREQLAGVTPPTEIAATHQLYLEGLLLEQQALDQLLEFYGSYDMALANRASLQLQDARAQIATATASWDAFAQQQSLVIVPAGAD